MKQLINLKVRHPAPESGLGEFTLRKMYVATYSHSHDYVLVCTGLTCKPRSGTGKKGGVTKQAIIKFLTFNTTIFTKGNTMTKSSTPQDVRAIGIAWYRLEDYSAILRIMTDGDSLPNTFHEWRMKAEEKEKIERRSGHTVVRVFIDTKTFPDWCGARGLNIDTHARMLYASTVVKETHGTTH